MIFAMINILILIITGIFCTLFGGSKNNKFLQVLGIMSFTVAFQSTMFMMVYIVDQYRLFGKWW